MKSVEFFFDVGSPAAYLAFKMLPRIAVAAEAEIIWRPMLLGGVFKATGNVSPMMIAAKGRHMHTDLLMFAAKYGVDYCLNTHFPINTLALMRGASSFLQEEGFLRYVEATFEAIWRNNKNLNDPTIVGELLTANGFDPGEFMRRIDDQAVKERLKADTATAVERGIFGAPTMFVGEQMFFGQDRLHFVAEALGIDFCDVCPKFIAADPSLSSH